MPGAKPCADAAAAIIRFEGLLTQHTVGVSMYEGIDVYLIQEGVETYHIVFPWDLDEHADNWLVMITDHEGLVYHIEEPVYEYLQRVEDLS